MILKRCSVLKHLIVVLVSSMCVGIMMQSDASAYFNTNNEKTAQCFAISYKVLEANVQQMVQGEKTDTGTAMGDRYATNRICAYIDKDGKVSGDLVDKKAPPLDMKSTTIPQLSSNGKAITLSYCSDGDSVCSSNSLVGKISGTVETKSFLVKDYATFYDLAYAVNNYSLVPKQYKINISGITGTKEALKDANGNEINGSAADAANEAHEAKVDGDKIEGSDDGGGSSEVLQNCENQGGAKSLGWIVCPIMKLLSDASDNIYTEYVEPSLRVDPNLFSDKNQGVEMAWGTFRNIANIVFVILLLLVIFSQLTGVGIDNYGIKKILPKLIVAAILINLSYVLCVLAVDISNILGNSFQSLFNGLSNQLPDPQGLDIESGGGSTHIELGGIWGALASVGILVSIVMAVGAIWQNPAIILSLLVSALGVFISIVFLFIMLATREAAVVVLTAISPVAMVCYLLPNTKSLFDKWLKGFKGLLLVYPICGLLVGGGNYVAKLIMTAGFGGRSGFAGFTAAFTAMIAGIVPIFFIPMVLRNSFTALGNLGTMITNAGRGASRGATGRIREGGVYKNAQESGRMRQTRIRAGVDAEGNARSFGRIGTIMRGGKRNLARNRAQYLKDQEFNDRADSLAGVGMDAAIIGQQKRAEAEDLSNYMTLINDKTRNGEDENALYDMFDNYMAAGNKTGAVAVARIAGRRKDTAANFIDNKLTNPGVSYDSGMLQSVAKEVATGENSGTYRAASPLGFEFASQINKAQVGEGGGLEADTNYANWSAQSGNVKSALDHHVTNSSELVGMKNSSLDEIANMMESGQMDQATMQRLGTLAQSTIDNKGMGPWDSTKESNITRIARFANSGGNNGGATISGTSIDISHNTPTNIGGGGGADSVSE